MKKKNILASFLILTSSLSWGTEPANSKSAWLMAKKQDLVVVGKLLNPKILIVFADGKPVQLGGNKVIQNKNDLRKGLSLMGADLEIEEVIFDKHGKFTKKTTTPITWVNIVSLRKNYETSIAGCQTLDRDAKNGKRSLLFISHNSIGLEADWNMDIKHLEWLRKERDFAKKVAAKEALEKKKRDELPSTIESDPFKE